MKSKENTPKTLHLVLKSKWFDKIASGEKTSEYRACSKYWNKRFVGYDFDTTEAYPICVNRDVKHYDTVVFHKGYTNNTMEFEIKHIHWTNDGKNDLHLMDVWEIKLGQEISCASCGKRVKAGNTFTSLEIHNDLGLGYLVCEQCYSKEIPNQTRDVK